MKKGFFLRAAAVLMILTLFSSSIISGTFAKYVTSANVTDSARVAKWGVNITGTSDIFAKTYAKDDSTFILDANTVSSDAKVVAPGTKGKLADFTISGTPEVAVRLSYTADLTLTGWTLSDDSTLYCPLVFKVKVGSGSEQTFKIDGTNTTTTELETAVENAIAEAKSDYKVGDTLNAPAITVSWEWAYSTDETNDINDTVLGNKGTAPSIELKVTLTATQID